MRVSRSNRQAFGARSRRAWYVISEVYLSNDLLHFAGSRGPDVNLACQVCATCIARQCSFKTRHPVINLKTRNTLTFGQIWVFEYCCRSDVVQMEEIQCLHFLQTHDRSRSAPGANDEALLIVSTNRPAPSCFQA